MSLFMPDASLALFIRMHGNLSAILHKVEVYAAEHKIEPVCRRLCLGACRLVAVAGGVGESVRVGGMLGETLVRLPGWHPGDDRAGSVFLGAVGARGQPRPLLERSVKR